MVEGNRRIPGGQHRANSKPSGVKRDANRAKKPGVDGNRKVTKAKRADIGGRLHAYAIHHKASAIDAFRRLVQTPGQTLPTCLVIAIALALPTLFYLLLNNLEGQAQRWQSPAQISVYLHKRASPAAIENLQQQLDSRGDIDATRYISEAQALREFQETSGFTDVLSSLDDNPLPAVIVVTPKQLSVESMSALTEQLAGESIVDSVQLDLEWVARLQQIVAVASRLATVLTALLALGVVLIVGNVIRLSIANRKEEIVIAKLVGASNGFVRRPFLYTGVCYGLFGGLLAVIMVALAAFWLASPVARLATLYAANFELQGLGFNGAISLVFGASVLGCLGAWLSVSRHLASIKPS